MKKEVCDQLISEAEQFCQKLGGDLYEVMKKAPQVVEKWKRHYFLAQELWKNARTREDLTAFLLSGPDPSPEELETLLTFIRTVPYVLRDGLQSAAKSLPPPPGGRPRGTNAAGVQDNLRGNRVAVRPGSGAAGCPAADGAAL